jgi:hypothetical protein
MSYIWIPIGFLSYLVPGYSWDYPFEDNIQSRILDFLLIFLVIFHHIMVVAGVGKAIVEVVREKTKSKWQNIVLLILPMVIVQMDNLTFHQPWYFWVTMIQELIKDAVELHF